MAGTRKRTLARARPRELANFKTSQAARSFRRAGGNRRIGIPHRRGICSGTLAFLGLRLLCALRLTLSELLARSAMAGAGTKARSVMYSKPPTRGVPHFRDPAATWLPPSTTSSDNCPIPSVTALGGTTSHLDAHGWSATCPRTPEPEATSPTTATSTAASDRLITVVGPPLSPMTAAPTDAGASCPKFTSSHRAKAIACAHEVIQERAQLTSGDPT